MEEQTVPVGVEPTKNVAGNGALPDELRGWNWGAFLLNWIWGIGHSVWIALLCFIPVAGWIMPFVLGFKGNEWAWQHRKFKDVEEFKAVQKAWTKWGVIVFVVGILLSIAMFSAIGSMFSSLNNGLSYDELNSLDINELNTIDSSGSDITPYEGNETLEVQ